MQGLLPYIIRRLLWAPVILLAVSFIAFTITRFGPGDPLRVAMGQYSDPAVLERVRHEEGLDKPLLQQYGIYLENLAHGKLGESFIYRNRDVSEVIFPKIWVSARLGLVAMLIVFAVGVPLGVYAALRQGTWADPLSISVLLFFQSVPVLITVPIMLMVFVLKLHWLPAAGWGGVFDSRIVMPALAISLPGIAGVARLTRATTLSVLREDYVRTARAKGLPEQTVVLRHALANAAVPIVTVIGIGLALLIGGVVVTESVYSIPGLGRLTVDAVLARDFPTIQGVILLFSVAYVLINLLIDLSYLFLDPRIRY